MNLKMLLTLLKNPVFFLVKHSGTKNDVVIIKDISPTLKIIVNDAKPSDYIMIGFRVKK